jgi:hypothetical protein
MRSHNQLKLVLHSEVFHLKYSMHIGILPIV